MSRGINMKAVFILIFAIIATINGSETDEEFLNLFQKALPADAHFVTVGQQCSINSVAFPNMYLYMKHYRFFTTDHLKLKEGNPRKTEGSDGDWRGLWMIQKYSNSKSNITEYRLKDQENNKYATFAPASENMFFPKGETKLFEGILWNLDVPSPNQEIVTYIRNASPKNNANKEFSLFLSVFTDAGPHQNGNRTVYMTFNLFDDSNLCKWKISCK